MTFLSEIIMGKPVWMWLTFMGVVLFLIVLDLGFLNRKMKEISVKKSLWMTAFYIGISLLYGAGVWHFLGEQSGTEFLTGFLIEKTLAMDNVFLISLIFTYFNIPRIYQHRVLFWGILGAILMRGLLIAFGAVIITQFSWVLHVFAGFLIITGIKMLFMGDKPLEIENNTILKFLRKIFKITPELHGQKFFVKKIDDKTGKLINFVTPLLICLILIEFVDLVFALDSIPAIFAISTDPFIVFTSNIFAILGLRSLYFALSAIIHRFKYLKVSLALILIFIGSKVFIADLLGMEKFPASISLSGTIALLANGIIISLYKTRSSKDSK